MLKTALLLLSLLALPPGAAGVPITDEKLCLGGSEAAVTVPAPVSVPVILEALGKLKTKEGKPAFELTVPTADEVRTTFDTTKVKTKMEQFYSLLYLIAQYLPKEFGNVVTLDATAVRDVLLASAVFRTTDLPNRICEVKIERYDREQPRYEVFFDGSDIFLPLNNGEGFRLYRNGLCQHAQKLIFRNRFSFQLKRLGDGNLVARYFTGVDLFGVFGNRGIVDVDINYIELRSVEFYRGTRNGKVTAYVSDEEFKKNEHNFLLRLVTKFVPDRSVQPIDW
ncbi:MAG: hypothetical protein V1495_05365 [Pseudomonadota bacterium]